MVNLVDIGSTIISQSQRRVEVAGQNVANIATPGYKKQAVFASLLPPDTLSADRFARQDVYTDYSPGRPIVTGNPFDLAIAGEGFFAVRADEQILYTRQGQFQRQGDGRVVTADGFALQTRGGGDLVLKGGDFKVTEDGTVVENGEPVAKLALSRFIDPRTANHAQGGAFSSADANVREVDVPSVRQGSIEASNVSTGDEMVTMMEALRRAESGQRVVNVYDDLMGRALSAFGGQ